MLDCNHECEDCPNLFDNCDGDENFWKREEQKNKEEAIKKIGSLIKGFDITEEEILEYFR